MRKIIKPIRVKYILVALSLIMIQFTGILPVYAASPGDQSNPCGIQVTVSQDGNAISPYGAGYHYRVTEKNGTFSIFGQYTYLGNPYYNNEHSGNISKDGNIFVGAVSASYSANVPFATYSWSVALTANQASTGLYKLSIFPPGSSETYVWIYIDVAPSYTTPSVQTYSATNISESQALLNGNVSSDGGATTNKYFSATGYAGQGAGAYSAWWSGLTPNSYYTYYAYASNAAGTVYGSTEGFYTLASVPSLTGVTPLPNGDVNITLNRNNNPSGTQFYVQSATDAAFTQNVTTALNWINPGVGTTLTIPKAVLSPGTPYYFRVKARNAQNIETAYGAGTTNILMRISDPPSPTITVDSETQLSVNWLAAIGASAYDVYENDVLILENTTDINVIRTELTPNTLYRYEVVSKNVSGNSVKSISASKNTFAAVPDLSEAVPQQNGDILLTIDKKNNSNTVNVKLVVSNFLFFT